MEPNEELTDEEKKLFRFFVMAFEKVVSPSVDSLEADLRQEIKSSEDRLSSRLDLIDHKLDHFSAKVAEYDIQIKKLKASQSSI